jgi:hypothetical protein
VLRTPRVAVVTGPWDGAARSFSLSTGRCAIHPAPMVRCRWDSHMPVMFSSNPVRNFCDTSLTLYYNQEQVPHAQLRARGNANFHGFKFNTFTFRAGGRQRWLWEPDGTDVILPVGYAVFFQLDENGYSIAYGPPVGPDRQIYYLYGSPPGQSRTAVAEQGALNGN